MTSKLYQEVGKLRLHVEFDINVNGGETDLWAATNYDAMIHVAKLS